MQTVTSTDTDSNIPAPAHFNLIVAQRAQAIVDIAIIGSTERFQSAIIAVDPNAQTIAIDELFPAGCTALPGQRVIVTLRLDNERRESFSTAIIQRRAGAGYLLQLPDSIDYHERRADYRVAMPRSAIGNGELFTPGSRRCAGLRARCFAEWTPSRNSRVVAVAGGRRARRIAFRIIRSAPFMQCRAQVRNIRVKNTSSIEIGASFIDLSRPQQRALERSLMQWQRHQAASVAQQRAGSDATATLSTAAIA